MELVSLSQVKAGIEYADPAVVSTSWFAAVYHFTDAGSKVPKKVQSSDSSLIVMASNIPKTGKCTV